MQACTLWGDAMAKRNRRRHKNYPLRADVPRLKQRLHSPIPPRLKLGDRLRVDRTIQHLGRKTLRELAGIWRNALSRLGEPSQDKELHKLLDAIGREWRRRARGCDPDEYFKWPTTDAPGGGSGLSTQGWPTDGLLTFLGYHVGRTNGLEPSLRRSILVQIFQSSLPPFHSPDYMAQWAQPRSAMRLKKLADSIASFARNCKRRHNPLLDEAVSDWENDLGFLFDEFYVGYFHFAWPSTLL